MDDILRELGLEEKEIKIYKDLVRKKQLTAYQIGKNTGINRSTVYDNLNKLVKKGFISTVIIQGKKIYQVNELNKILSFLKEKETLVQALAPEIKKLKTEKEITVELLEGVEGQREYFFSLFSLAKSKRIKSVKIIGSGDVSTIGSWLYIKRLVTEWKKLKLSKSFESKVLWDESFRGTAIVKQINPYGENRFLPNFPSVATTSIFGDYLVIALTTDKPYVIRVKNKLVANTFEHYFKIMWELAKR